jgi:hypothetical protein
MQAPHQLWSDAKQKVRTRSEEDCPRQVFGARQIFVIRFSGYRKQEKELAADKRRQNKAH